MMRSSGEDGESGWRRRVVVVVEDALNWRRFEVKFRVILQIQPFQILVERLVDVPGTMEASSESAFSSMIYHVDLVEQGVVDELSSWWTARKRREWLYQSRYDRIGRRCLNG